jgi:hypothetical protein
MIKKYTKKEIRKLYRVWLTYGGSRESFIRFITYQPYWSLLAPLYKVIRTEDIT